MASYLIKALSLLAPAPPRAPRENDGFTGYQWVQGRFVFRPSWYLWEMLLLMLALLYVVWWQVGARRNKQIARDWMNGVLPTLQEQFSFLSPAPSPTKPNEAPLRADGPSTYLSYASGRRNIVSLHSTVSLFPRHDPLRTLFQTVRPMLDVSSSPAEDEMTFDLLLRPVEDGCDVKFERMSGQVVMVREKDSDGGGQEGVGLASGTFATVRKDRLKNFTKDRWDLTFPTIQSDEAISRYIDSSELVVLSEHSDCNHVIFSPLSSGGSGLKELLADDLRRAALKSLSISDLPFSKPVRALPGPAPLQISVTFSLPASVSPSEFAIPYLTVLLNLADLLSNGPNTSPASAVTSGKVDNSNSFWTLRPETLRRLRQTREAAWKEIEGGAASTRSRKPDNVSQVGGDEEETAEERRKRERKEGKASVEKPSAKEMRKKEEAEKQRKWMAALREAQAAKSKA